MENLSERVCGMNIEVNMNEINSVEKIVSNMLVENDFNQMNNLINKKESEINNKFLFPNVTGSENAGFVSIKKAGLKPFVKIMSEEEFFKIVGKTKRGLSSKSGRYQEHLYSHYLEAVKMNDEGYISDILHKALEFKTNLSYIKSLIKDEAFANEWRKDFGNESAIEIFKRKGNMRIVDIVKERAK